MRLLLVEDDKDLCNAVYLQLADQGYQVDCCQNGEDALYYVDQSSYDAIILDRMLPKLDGLSVLQIIRKKRIVSPVIITTALDGIHDRIDGLDSGADDYLVKPYAVEELLARIRALTRRPNSLKHDSMLSFGDLSLDFNRHELKGPSKTVTLSRRETALMEYFMRNARQVLPRNLILSYIWGPSSEVEEGNLDNYVYFLRRRLKSLNSSNTIKTIHGVGYRLENPYD